MNDESYYSPDRLKGKHFASEIAPCQVRMWLHLPISLLRDPEGALQANKSGWIIADRSNAPDFSSQSYFHSFVADTLWGDAARFRRFLRTTQEENFEADFVQFRKREGLENEKVYCGQRFIGKVGQVELLTLSQQAQNPIQGSAPGFAILVIPLTVNSVRRSWWTTNSHDTSALEAADDTKLSLADAQDALESLRRCFTRFWTDDKTGADMIPGDTAMRVSLDGCAPLLAPTKSELADVLDGNGSRRARVPVFDWFAHWLSPIELDDDMATHFGDERCYTTSSVAIGHPDLIDKAARDLLRDIHDGEMFRLAEADRSGEGYNYQRPFLEKLRDTYFYTRHAPDPEGDFGNSTVYLTAHHHLCAVGAGRFAHDQMHRDVETYYRHMQFLCVFEYFRLIQFSQRLTALVAQKPDISAETFNDALLSIREDFLTFTHLDHFTSVSTQLQGRELFARLQQAMELPGLFREVENELRSAADYAAMKDARDQGKRSEQLNDLIALGVPAGLAVALADIEASISGALLPGSWYAEKGGAVQDYWAQSTLLALIVFSIWGVGFMAMADETMRKRQRMRFVSITGFLAVLWLVLHMF